ncbi:MAG: response regulator, partial [Candidatus Accumulibacter sp.]|nr:response regulator [Accumulibacter sp.]
AIIGMTELILRDDVSSTVRDYALSVKQAGRNLLAIINDILDFSKIEAGKMDLVPVEYKTASLINDVVSITRMRIEDKPVAFVANIDANFPETLLGDEVRVRQILINLLSNAAKYTQKGCITLTVTSQEAAPGERMAVFEVKDTGIGIRKENLGKLFNEFTQFDSHKNYATEGTGLGLPISRHLARAMGGDIAVRSKYGKGSIFTATVRQKLPPGPPAPIAHVRDAASKKVLVFENDKIQAHSLAWSFESLGVPFRIAPSKTRLRKALAEENFDFVFVSSALAGAGNKRTLPKAGGARLALMTSQGEGATENPDMPAIQRPLHTIVIANAMNGVPGARSCAEDATPARFTAPEARILVVDDVLSNLKVVEGLLEPFDIGMDFCLDGKEAVYQIRKKDYDFVLMDHMMPGMDGVETVREIRALPGEKYKKLPIIALTANAVSGMKEMFLLNGFDDYISKPIEISKLYRIVEKWTPPEKWVRLASPPPEAAAPAAPGEALDLAIEGVDARRGLALAGGKARVYLEVLRLFGKDADARAETFAKAPDVNSMSDFITHVHALKSAAANVGATKVSNAARFLEEAGKSGDFAAIARRLPAFRRALAALSANIKTALKAVLAQSEADDADIRPATIADADLAELKDALKRGEVRRADALLDALRRQPLGKDDKKTLSEISDYVLMSEFEAAVEATAALATSEENE